MCYVLYATNAFATGKILINEFLVDPPPQQVELINAGDETVEISNWYIDDNGGTTYFSIPVGSILYPNSCLVFSSEFNLNKSSPDTVRLFNNAAPPTSSAAQLIDSFSYKASSGSAVSFFRLPDGENTWATGSSSFEKFNKTRESCLIFPTDTPTKTPTASPSPSDTAPQPTSVPISYNNIFLSEVMVNPPTGEKEWVEIYNDNDFTVTLSNWYIDDIENAGGSPKSFSLTIAAKQYGVYELSSSLFNNDGDSARLLDSQKIEKDSFEYEKTEKGKTLGRNSLDNDKVCIQESSKGTVNNPCLARIIPTVTASISPTSTAKHKALATPNLKRTNNQTSSQLSSANVQNGLIPNGEVLGGFNKVQPAQSKATLPKHLSFLSLSYSLLTLASVFLRMKFNA